MWRQPIINTVCWFHLARELMAADALFSSDRWFNTTQAHPGCYYGHQVYWVQTCTEHLHNRDSAYTYILKEEGRKLKESRACQSHDIIVELHNWISFSKPKTTTSDFKYLHHQSGKNQLNQALVSSLWHNVLMQVFVVKKCKMYFHGRQWTNNKTDTNQQPNKLQCNNKCTLLIENEKPQ